MTIRVEIFETKRSPSNWQISSLLFLFLRRYNSSSRSNRTKRIGCSTGRRKERMFALYVERYGGDTSRFRHWDTRAWCARGENQWSGVRLIRNSRFKDERRGNETTTASDNVHDCSSFSFSFEQPIFFLGFFQGSAFFFPFQRKRCFLTAWKKRKRANTHTRTYIHVFIISCFFYVHWE